MNECEAISLLEKHKLKITDQRLLALNEMIHTHSFFSANSLYKNLKNNMDLATVYRMLLIFQKKNMIREVATKDGVRFYELVCVHQSAHPHFLCKQCDTMYCLDIDVAELTKLKRFAPRFLVEDVSLLLTGICDHCK